MAVGGAEPISSGNLAAVMGAGLPRMETLFSGSSTSVTLPRAATEYDVLLVSSTEPLTGDGVTFVLVPKSGSTSCVLQSPYGELYANISGSALNCTEDILCVIGVRY